MSIFDISYWHHLWYDFHRTKTVLLDINGKPWRATLADALDKEQPSISTFVRDFDGEVIEVKAKLQDQYYGRGRGILNWLWLGKREYYRVMVVTFVPKQEWRKHSTHVFAGTYVVDPSHNLKEALLAFLARVGMPLAQLTELPEGAGQ